MDEELLYGDLEAAGELASRVQLQHENDELRKTNTALEAENVQLRSQVATLVSDRTQLETNMGTCVQRQR